MAKARVVGHLPAPPDVVWSMLEDFGDLSAWAPAAELVHVEGKGEGAVRRINSPMGVFVERCAQHDPGTHTFAYEFLESPLPFKNYRAVVTLRPLEGGRTEIEWSSEFDPGAIDEFQAVEQVEITFRDSFIATLRSTLSTR